MKNHINKKFIKNAIFIRLYSINRIKNVNILKKGIKYFINNCIFYENGYFEYFIAIDCNINLALQKILLHRDEITRKNLAKNKNLDISIQNILASDYHYFVRYTLAQNPNIDISTQHELINKSASPFKRNYVKEDLAQNPNIDITIQEILVKDESKHTRSYLASNPNIDFSIRDILENDEDQTVRMIAIRQRMINEEY
jgi:hypothetical protein